MLRGADISPCGLYRYRLWRDSGKVAAPRICFVMLNPSTADAEQDDPTIRRCLGFAKSLGYENLDVVNLYAFRTTDPQALSDTQDPVGPLNDLRIEQTAEVAQLVVAAWGATVVKVGLSGTATARTALRISKVAQLLARYAPVHCLGTTQAGAPKHPLYVRGDTQPVLWRARHG